MRTSLDQDLNPPYSTQQVRVLLSMSLDLCHQPCTTTLMPNLQCLCLMDCMQTNSHHKLNFQCPGCTLNMARNIMRRSGFIKQNITHAISESKLKCFIMQNMIFSKKPVLERWLACVEVTLLSLLSYEIMNNWGRFYALFRILHWAIMPEVLECCGNKKQHHYHQQNNSLLKG